VSRRETVAAGTAAVLAGFLNVAPAQAFLGFGEGEARAAAYKAETVRQGHQTGYLLGSKHIRLP
jgi:hypothetical protein